MYLYDNNLLMQLKDDFSQDVDRESWQQNSQYIASNTYFKEPTDRNLQIQSAASN